MRAWPDVRYLASDISSDPETLQRVELVLGDVEKKNLEALEALESTPGEWNRYVGAAACARCHAQAHATWEKTGHAKAREGLEIDHQVDNPDCLRCHVTSFGMPGGFPHEPPDLSGVQCEACHGPGGGHPPRKMQSPEVSQEFCGGCHTPRDSPLFDPEGFWQLIRHGRGGK